MFSLLTPELLNKFAQACAEAPAPARDSTPKVRPIRARTNGRGRCAAGQCASDAWRATGRRMRRAELTSANPAATRVTRRRAGPPAASARRAHAAGACAANSDDGPAARRGRRDFSVTCTLRGSCLRHSCAACRVVRDDMILDVFGRTGPGRRSLRSR